MLQGVVITNPPSSLTFPAWGRKPLNWANSCRNPGDSLLSPRPQSAPIPSPTFLRIPKSHSRLVSNSSLFPALPSHLCRLRLETSPSPRTEPRRQDTQKNICVLFPGPPLHLVCFFGTLPALGWHCESSQPEILRGPDEEEEPRVRPQPPSRPWPAHRSGPCCPPRRVPWVPSRRDWDSRMDRPVPSRALGQRPPALSVLATPTPSSGAASTIYVSSAAGAPTQHHQLRHAHPALQSDAGGATLRRGPKRAARGELGAPEESPGLWGSGSPAKPAGPDRNGHGPSPGLGTSPEDRDSSTASPTASASHSRKKQKRNKPTLSCFECVERKTKVCEI